MSNNKAFVQRSHIDESGDTGMFSSKKTDSQPVFVLLGLTLPSDQLRAYTSGFVNLKKEYFPNSADCKHHNTILNELKGSDLRKVFAKNNNQKIRHVVGFFNKLLELISQHDGKIMGRAYNKEPDGEARPIPIYTAPMQKVCTMFNA